jgi:hypothetical protein
MILLVGLLLGLIAGYGRAWLQMRPYAFPEIRQMELVLLAFLPQALVFFVPQTGRFVSHQWAALILPLSLAILVLFVWHNRRLQGFWLLGLGLLLNMAVIAANGGLMPTSPETLAIVHGTTVDNEQAQALVDSRAFGSKNVVLPVEETRLEWLADRFTVPEELPIQFAFSLGDVFLAAGAFWALWVGSAVRRPTTEPVLDGKTILSESQRRV